MADQNTFHHIRDSIRSRIMTTGSFTNEAIPSSVAVPSGRYSCAKYLTSSFCANWSMKLLLIWFIFADSLSVRLYSIISPTIFVLVIVSRRKDITMIMRVKGLETEIPDFFIIRISMPIKANDSKTPKPIPERNCSVVANIASYHFRRHTPFRTDK